MQLLEPERYPHLYKCLYGLLMLLPQSSAFAALKNRLNSVSAIGYLHIAPRANPYVNPSSSPTLNHLRQKSSEVGSSSGSGTPSGTPGSNFGETRNRIGMGLKPREDDGKVKWGELLDRFKQTQEKARRSQRMATLGEDLPINEEKEKERMGPAAVQPKAAGAGRPGSPAGAMRPPSVPPPNQVQGHKPRSSLSLGRFAGGVGGRKKK
jgi:vacuole morphology and inheritance protein 14